MPIITDWEFEEFSYADITSQRISFNIDDHEFIMFFTPIEACSDIRSLAEKADMVGFEIPRNSYDVKFDRAENFESGDFYKPPSTNYSRFDYIKMRRLGDGLCKILSFHYSVTNAEAYFGVAENPKLKSYYDRLIRTYAKSLGFNVIGNLGEEGLHYAIKTPKYKG